MPMLKCEQNTPEMADRVLAAAAAGLDVPQRELEVAFEHGQWWVTRRDDGAQWSVDDAEGPGSTDGFGFEQVTIGDGR
jgi:hypothetical protein